MAKISFTGSTDVGKVCLFVFTCFHIRGSRLVEGTGEPLFVFPNDKC